MSTKPPTAAEQPTPVTQHRPAVGPDRGGAQIRGERGRPQGRCRREAHGDCGKGSGRRQLRDRRQRQMLTTTCCGRVATVRETCDPLAVGEARGSGWWPGGESGVIAGDNETEGVRMEGSGWWVFHQLFFCFWIWDCVSRMVESHFSPTTLTVTRKSGSYFRVRYTREEVSTVLEGRWDYGSLRRWWCGSRAEVVEQHNITAHGERTI